MSAKARLVVGGLTVVIGMWLFVFPYIAPRIGMPLGGTSTHATATSKAASSSSAKPPKILLDKAVAYGFFVPGIVLVLAGSYMLASAAEERRAETRLNLGTPAGQLV